MSTGDMMPAIDRAEPKLPRLFDNIYRENLFFVPQLSMRQHLGLGEPYGRVPHADLHQLVRMGEGAVRSSKYQVIRQALNGSGSVVGAPARTQRLKPRQRAQHRGAEHGVPICTTFRRKFLTKLTHSVRSCRQCMHGKSRWGSEMCIGHVYC